jgi:hypothetical protein
LRGGDTDPYDPDGFGPPEPSVAAVLAWSGVAAVALLIAVSALVYGLPDPPPRPEVAASPAPAPAPNDSTAVTSGGAGIVSRSDFTMRSTSDEPGSGLAALQVENAALRQAVQTLQGEIATLMSRLEGIEGKLESVTGSVAPRAEPVETPVPAPPPVPVRQVPPPPVETVRRTAFGVELGAFADMGSARIAWRELVEAEPALFADLEPIASVRDRDGRLELLLVAGPFATADDAAARCALAEAERLDCLPAFYVGQPLTSR